MVSIRALALILLCSTCLTAVSAGAVYQLYPLSLSLSPDGRFMSFIRQERTATESLSPSTGLTLWVHDLSRGASQQVIVSDFTERPSPAWSSDGQKLAFFSAAGQDAVLLIWDRLTGRIIRRAPSSVCTAADCSTGPQWTPDGRFVLFVAQSSTQDGAVGGSQRVDLDAELTGGMSSPSGIAVLPSAPQKPDVLHQSPGPIRSLVALDLKTGAERVLATHDTFANFQVSADGRLLAVSSSEGWNSKRSQYEYSIHSLSLSHALESTMALRTLARHVPMWMGCTFSLAPSGRYVAYSTLSYGAPSGEVFVLDIASGRSRKVSSGLPPANGKYGFTGNFGWRTLAPLWSADETSVIDFRSVERADADVPLRFEIWRLFRNASRALRVPADSDVSIIGVPADAARSYLPAWSGTRHELVAKVRFLHENVLAYAAIDLDSGKVHVLHRSGASPLGEVRGSLEHAQGMLAVPASGRTAVAVDETVEQPPELWRLDWTSAQGAAKSLGLLNPGPVPAHGELHRVTWTSPAGDKLGALLHLPANVPANSRVPIVVWVYFLSSGESRLGFSLFDGGKQTWDPLLARGRYAVLIPDLPVSKGEGTACDELAANTLAALDAAIATGHVDRNRAGIMGYSFGGYIANCVITRTNRFRAAVSGAGLSDLVSSLLQDVREDRTVTPVGGPWKTNAYPWEEPARFIADSPVYHLDKVSAPLLLIYGKKDARVAREQAIEMYTGLKILNKSAQLVAYDGRDHLTVPLHPDFWPRVLRWFDSYL